jgi:hypothetical protein
MPKLLTVLTLVALSLLPATVTAQTAPLKGDAILKHPIGLLAVKATDLIAADQIDAYQALRTKEDQNEWKKASAAEKQQSGRRLKENAPTPAVFADIVRKAGELTINGDTAVLGASTPAGLLRQVFSREGGAWRVSFGPYFEPTRPPAVRVEGPALTNHPAIAVVLQYVDLVQANKTEEAITRFGSTNAQADWKAQPASEKRESAAFRKRILPTRADLTRSIAAGGVLLVEGDHATLNVIKMDPATATKSTGSSTTVAIPLALENGTWKIAQ